MQKNYKSLVFTDHALDRLGLRLVTQEMVYQVVTTFQTKYAVDQSTKFVKTIKQRKLQVVANYLKKEDKWLIISVWVRGEEDQPSIFWKIISFPFWLVWQALKKIWPLFFHS
ncbi:MAG: hypothetical protein COU66_01835 [Candidatus Pacebacteria bacterium CG10_big_fil_rev_8_21_14_0_10_44_11]|nr:MAG: hypothetical protein COU66_01835 [Candidatus Pacebacteria bacterium CG10_big_fil_rev_8_21_14_0_10_44_11]